VANRLRAEGVDCRRRGKDRRPREESGELRTELATGPRQLSDEEMMSTAVRVKLSDHTKL